MKIKDFKIIDEHVLFYSNNLDLLPPKPKLSFRYLKQDIQEFLGSMFCLKLIKLLIMLLLCDCFVVYSTRRFVIRLSVCHFVLVFFSPFSIAIASLGEERANLSAFRTFVRFVLV